MGKLNRGHQKTIKPSKGWLWWTAFFVLFVGGVISYILSMENTYQADVYMRTTIMVSVIISGICIISAMADRFF